MTFAQVLKAAREAAGLTQLQVAELTGIAVGTLRDYEQGTRKKNPSLLNGARLAKLLGVPVQVFAAAVLAEAEANERRAKRKG